MPWVDKIKCIGCGICADICPKGIEIIEGKARIKDKNADCLEKATNTCPRGAIILEGENEKTKPNEITPTNFNQYRRGRGRGFGAGRGRGLGRGPRDGRGKDRGAG